LFFASFYHSVLNILFPSFFRFFQY